MKPPVLLNDPADLVNWMVLRKLLGKGKNKGVVMTAVGRELLGFIWAIGIQVETGHKKLLQRAA